MKDKCLKKKQNNEIDNGEEKSNLSISTYNKFIEKKEEGKWSGWGYFYSLKSKKYFDSPIFISIKNDIIEVSKNDNMASFSNIDLKNLNYICNQTKICDLKNYKKFTKKANILTGIDSFDLWAVKINITNKEKCQVFEFNENKVKNFYFSFNKGYLFFKVADIICIYNKKGVEGFHESILKALINNNLMTSKKNITKKETIFSGIIYKDNNKIFNDEVEISDQGIKSTNGSILIKYEDIKSFSGEICEILTENIDIPENMLINSTGWNFLNNNNKK